MEPTRRVRGRPWEKLRKRVIANHNVCWICGLTVDKTLLAPDPLSPSVDHVIALQHGGRERDYSNLRLAHYGCNSARGDGTRTRKPTTSRQW